MRDILLPRKNPFDVHGLGGVVAGVLGHEGQVVIVDVVPGGGQGGVEGVGHGLEVGVLRRAVPQDLRAEAVGYFRRDGRIKRGQTICTVGFGAGLVYGSAVFEY